ncbi:MAG: tyrosine-type recombinase/integrase [Lachnospiraceae bacterium]|nr:tyrosine-type recombinase/integrase [Lachnospiraceae bacterium]
MEERTDDHNAYNTANRTDGSAAYGTVTTDAPHRIRELLEDFRRYLADRDKKPNTVEKYLRDARKFLSFCQGRDLDHSQVVRYREYLAASYAPSSVNSMLAALNGFLVFLGREDCCVRVLRVQRELFRDASRDMTVEEYIRLVKQADAEGNVRLSHMLQTMAGSGVRVGELSSITVESLDQKTVSISSKGKFRQILLPRTLVEKLRKYCRRMGVASGSIFVTSSGRPVDRRNIWKEMKNLCRRAGVAEGKVFPHNLRHLFARCFYEKEKDIVRLADYLGHSSVETTRRYTVTSEMEACRMSLEMGLLVDTEPENGHGGYGGSYGNRAGYRHKKRKVPATA